MNSENQQISDPSETHLIEDIDINGYLLGCDDDEVNHDNIIGRFFDTPDDVYTFYNQYAFVHGFGDNSSEVSKKRRRDVRTGCEAELRISKTKGGKWCVDIFNDTHNHDLTTTPTKVMKHRSHNKFHRSMACKSLMVELGKSGLRPCQVRKAVNAMKSPNEPTITSKQCADILAEERKQYKGKEFYSLIKHFQEKAAIDVNQYFKIDLFDDGSPRNIFWADGRSRDAYLKFGDVVVFDVTYLTNKFKFPFSPIVGVNHHGQSIIFGGALLENEKEETFKWLFKQFLKCMFNKCPSAIITDQDKAICNAVKHVFPNTWYSYCTWHIKKHVLEHLQPFRVRYSVFQEAFKKWVRSDNVEDFESQWVVLRDKYNLETCNWMMEMYKQRKFWTMLNEFVIQFDKAVDTRRVAEEDEDFKTMNSMPVLSFIHPIKAKARWTLDCRYKGGNASIRIEETNSENGVSALALWKKPTKIKNAYKDARVRISQVDMMPQILVRDPDVLTILKGRLRNAIRVKPPIKIKQKKT
ncbi:FAR1-related sequence 5-like protein, partial [Tanacetum coccineum]